MSIFDREGRLIIALSRQDMSDDAERCAHELLAEGDAGIDWAVVLDQAVQHRVAPLMSRNVERLAAEGRRLRLDRGMGSTLKAIRLYHLERNRVALAELDGILDAAAAGSVEVVLRKGAHLLQDVYRDPGLRPIGDLDLLVPPDQAPTLVALLADRGYQQGVSDGGRVRQLSRRESLFWRLYGSDLPKLNKHTGSPYLPLLNLDINVSLVLPGKGGQLPVDELLRRCVVREAGPRSQRFLSPVDCLLDLCLHIYKNSTALRFMNLGKHRRLLKYVDLVEYLATHRDQFAWEEFVARAQEYGLRAPMFYTLAHLDLLFPGEVPKEVLAECGADCGDAELFLRQYGQWDAAEPRVWAHPFDSRFFNRATDDVLPRSRSLV